MSSAHSSLMTAQFCSSSKSRICQEHDAVDESACNLSSSLRDTQSATKSMMLSKHKTRKLEPIRLDDEIETPNSHRGAWQSSRALFFFFNPASGQPLTITPTQLFDFCHDLMQVVLQIFRFRIAALRHLPDFRVQGPRLPREDVIAHFFPQLDIQLQLSVLHFLQEFSGSMFFHPLLYGDVLILLYCGPGVFVKFFNRDQFVRHDQSGSFFLNCPCSF